MSHSSDNSCCSLPPVPSPQELSHILTDPDLLQTISRKFAQKRTTTAVLRYYNFLSSSIATLEEELERHQQERETIYDHLFESQSFTNRLQPIVSEYRHRRALHRRGFHPYGQMRSPSPPNAFSANKSPSPEGFRTQLSPQPSGSINPLSQEDTQERVPIRLGSYDTALDETLGTSRRNPITILDGEEHECKECRGDHELRHCPKDTDVSPVWLRKLKTSIEKKMN